MNQNLTEMIFILDRSGSMESLTEETIGGFIFLIEKQKEEPGEARVTTVLFDDKYELLLIIILLYRRFRDLPEKSIMQGDVRRCWMRWALPLTG